MRVKWKEQHEFKGISDSRCFIVIRWDCFQKGFLWLSIKGFGNKNTGGNWRRVRVGLLSKDDDRGLAHEYSIWHNREISVSVCHRFPLPRRACAGLSSYVKRLETVSCKALCCVAVERKTASALLYFWTQLLCLSSPGVSCIWLRENRHFSTGCIVACRCASDGFCSFREMRCDDMIKRLTMMGCVTAPDPKRTSTQHKWEHLRESRCDTISSFYYWMDCVETRRWFPRLLLKHTKATSDALLPLIVIS